MTSVSVETKRNARKQKPTKWIVPGVVMLLVLGCLFAQVVAAAEIRNVTARQSYFPWNGKVDIQFEVAGTLTELKRIVAVDRIDGSEYVAEAIALSGDLNVGEGEHHFVWDLDRQGIVLQSSNVVFTVEGLAPANYCVVDLSAGSNASEYPVTWLEEAPSGGFNTDEYKTTKMVLRRIEPGTFVMGVRSTDYPGSDNDDLHEVTLTKSFYMGLFEVTQKQWELVMGRNVAYYGDKLPDYGGDMRPVDSVTYNEIRGADTGTNWPASSAVDATSFLGKLRERTGCTFDLPTEAQWEYACRAGTTTALNSGKNLTSDDTCPNMAEVGRYSRNRGDGKGGYAQHTTVGNYLPNAWGLYDMHGNVREWCLDWYGSRDSGPVTDPKGASQALSRVIRGGCWFYGPVRCLSGIPDCDPPNGTTVWLTGFRLVCIGGL